MAEGNEKQAGQKKGAADLRTLIAQLLGVVELAECENCETAYGDDDPERCAECEGVYAAVLDAREAMKDPPPPTSAEKLALRGEPTARVTDVEPHLRTAEEIRDLGPRFETMSDRLCQTQGMILHALKEAGLTVVPLNPSAREIAPDGAHLSSPAIPGRERQAMSDARYLRNDIGSLLGHVTEECGEVLAAVGKTMRWGLDSSNPELPPHHRETNREWILRELPDLELAISRLRKALAPPVPEKPSPTDAPHLGQRFDSEAK